MAGYVKIWTTIKSNEAFLSLSLTQKGAWYEILVDAKTQRDDGWVFYRNFTAMGQSWGCEGKTGGKILGILQENSLLTYTQNDSGVVAINIPNYKHWQELDVKTLMENSRKNPRKIPPLRPDQTRPDQIKKSSKEDVGKPTSPVENLNKELILYFAEKYQQAYKTEYLPTWGRDGKAIKTLLTQKRTPAEIKAKIDLAFKLDEPWLKNQCKTISGFAGQWNRILKPQPIDYSRPPGG